MDPITLGVIALVAVVAMGGKKEGSGSVANGPIQTPPPDDNGLMRGAVAIGSMVGPGLMGAASGTIGLASRVRDQVTGFGESNIANNVAGVARGAAQLGAFGLYVGGIGASNAAQAGMAAANAAAATETGKAVVDATKKAAKSYKDTADAAAKAAREAAAASDRAGAAFVRFASPWK